MILNNVIGSIHYYHNIQCVIVCQSSIHNAYVFCVLYLLDQTPQLVFISPMHQFCAASIREWRLFKSGIYFTQPIPSLTQKRAKLHRTIIYQTDKETHWLLLIGLLCCFEFASLVHDKFLRVHVLLMQVFVTPTTCSYYLRVAFILVSSCVWRCSYYSRAAINQEWRLIEWIQYLTCLVSSIIPTLEQEVMTCLMYTNYYTFLHKLGDIVIFHLANFTPVYCHPHTSCSVWYSIS